MHPVEALFLPLGKAFRNRRAGEAASMFNGPAFAADAPLSLTSSSFADGQEIPAKHCATFIGANISPDLKWGLLPAGTVQLLLVLEDVDGPGKTPNLHTVAAFGSDVDRLAEGALGRGAAGIQFQKWHGLAGRYSGPRPLPGHGTHHYRFHLYALDRAIDLNEVAVPALLAGAVSGHVLGAGMLTGTRAT
jgi:phosphatidylethanolamine-binding protein (PEBP) family uncharacterized protein